MFRGCDIFAKGKGTPLSPAERHFHYENHYPRQEIPSEFAASALPEWCETYSVEGCCVLESFDPCGNMWPGSFGP